MLNNTASYLERYIINITLDKARFKLNGHFGRLSYEVHY